MEKEISGSSKDRWAASRKYRYRGAQGEQREEENTYTQKFESKCPVDSSKVIHTVCFRKATCTRVDDTVEDFHCSRDSCCVKCQQNYW